MARIAGAKPKIQLRDRWTRAKKVIAAGRSLEALAEFAALGGDVAIPLAQNEEALEVRFKRSFAEGVVFTVNKRKTWIAEDIARRSRLNLNLTWHRAIP